MDLSINFQCFSPKHNLYIDLLQAYIIWANFDGLQICYTPNYRLLQLKFLPKT